MVQDTLSKTYHRELSMQRYLLDPTKVMMKYIFAHTLTDVADCNYNFREHSDDTKDQVHTNRPHFTHRDGTQTVPHQNLHGDYFKPQPRVK